ncbi:hypothetical protein [Mucilaginibacter sp.]|uniref:hypothetical protein n=1 Tax=Mucilaginibacter sp. TaxID=1882438 RepID=UPI0032658555
MNTKDKSSVLLSIFLRKGGEGLFTKVVNEKNKHLYQEINKYLENVERLLIIYFNDSNNWVGITNERIIFADNGHISDIFHSAIKEVRMGLNEEAKKGIMDKTLFTLIKVKTTDNKTYLLTLEKGMGFQGFFQVLHFLAG